MTSTMQVIILESNWSKFILHDLERLFYRGDICTVIWVHKARTSTVRPRKNIQDSETSSGKSSKMKNCVGGAQ